MSLKWLLKQTNNENFVSHYFRSLNNICLFHEFMIALINPRLYSFAYKIIITFDHVILIISQDYIT